ncbi:MAG: choice-of-anchor tandem repeat GloVer-containing protein [Terriglobales bacterium]
MFSKTNFYEKNNNVRAKLAALLLTLVLATAAGALVQGTYETLYKFTNSNDGREPGAPLISDQSTNLYGTTPTGGVNEEGTIFELIPQAEGRWKEKVLYNFCSLMGCVDGTQPDAGLIFDPAGSLYGTTAFGGANNEGTVFKLTPDSSGGWTESVLYSFCSLAGCSDGREPFAGLILDNAGNLYGTTSIGGNGNCYMSEAGCGAVFELTPKSDGSWKEGVLHAFCSLTSCTDGAFPRASLVLDRAGSLYGTASYGGDNQNAGVAFKLTPAAGGSWKEQVIHRFSEGADGATPQTSLIFDSVGNLYGTTTVGGAYGGGTVFELTQNSNGSWKEAVLLQFKGTNGWQPSASLILDGAGTLYGTTTYGGGLDCNCGIVYKLAPNSKGGWTETVLHKFDDRPGSHPVGNLIFDMSGNLCGTTKGDFQTTFGSVFKITP